MDGKVYEYESLLYEAGETGGACVIFPYDIRKEFGRGRVKVHATFDGEPYGGSIVNMGVRNADGSICYILGVRKDKRWNKYLDYLATAIDNFHMIINSNAILSGTLARYLVDDDIECLYQIIMDKSAFPVAICQGHIYHFSLFLELCTQ